MNFLANTSMYLLTHVPAWMISMISYPVLIIKVHVFSLSQKNEIQEIGKQTFLESARDLRRRVLFL